MLMGRCVIDLKARTILSQRKYITVVIGRFTWLFKRKGGHLFLLLRTKTL
ncbi:hypothetical protein ALT721_920010 [Alteromonas alvinellae]